MKDYGRLIRYDRLYETEKIQNMLKPVRCAYCAHVYDIGAVTVTARYADCSMWKTPCCDRMVDDRGETGWKTTQDYVVLKKERNG